MHYRRVNRLFHGFGTPSYTGSGSKSVPARILDYLYIFFVLNVMPNNYHLFGFDSKDRSQFKDYLGDTTEPVYYRELRSVFWANSILVHDKYRFKCLCREHGLPVPLNYAVIKDNRIDDNGTNLREFMLSKGLDRVIVKPVLGGGGRGIHLISPTDLDEVSRLQELDSGAGDFMRDGYLVEEVLEQHSDMNRINPVTLNSVRIVTMLCLDGSVEFLAAMLKTNSMREPMDNFSQGGIVIGIDLDTGRLKKYGVMEYPHGRMFTQHPLTHTEFLDFQIPLWQELKVVAEKAQQVFHQVKSVGWDIAVTSRGPVIIEGNQDWGTNGIQAANGGLLTPNNRALFAQYGITFYS